MRLCFHVHEVFLNNVPDVSGLSKFSINFRQSSFTACCFSSFRAHLFKCSFYNKNLFVSLLPCIHFTIDLSGDTVYGADTSSHLFILVASNITSSFYLCSSNPLIRLILFILISLGISEEKKNRAGNMKEGRKQAIM